MSSQLNFFPDEKPARITWSVSRDKRLKTCLRRYYFQHYGSRGGSRDTASADRRELYILKWLRNRYMWVGEIVHELVEEALEGFRTRSEVHPDELVRSGVQRMRAEYCESKQRVYRERPRLACGLFEHEYEERVSREEWQAQRKRMERCVRNFFSLPLVQVIRETPGYRWLALEETSSFVVDGSNVLVKPDFAWRDPEGCVHLVDWKTGLPRPEDETFQLAVYAIHGRREWGAAPHELRGHIAYLDRGEVAEFDIGERELSQAEQTIRDSLGTMRNLHESDPPAELFPMTSETGVCAMCNFKRLCRR